MREKERGTGGAYLGGWCCAPTHQPVLSEALREREAQGCVCVEGGRCEDRGRWMVAAARRVVVEEVPEQNERRR